MTPHAIDNRKTTMLLTPMLYFCSSKQLLLQWSNLRRAYTYVMALNMRHLLSRHRHWLFSEEAQKLFGCFQEASVFSATSLAAIDDNYSW